MSKIPAEKFERVVRLADAINDAGGRAVEFEITDDGDVRIYLDYSQDVSTFGSGVVVKNGG